MANEFSPKLINSNKINDHFNVVGNKKKIMKRNKLLLENLIIEREQLKDK